MSTMRDRLLSLASIGVGSVSGLLGQPATPTNAPNGRLPAIKAGQRKAAKLKARRRARRLGHY